LENKSRKVGGVSGLGINLGTKKCLLGTKKGGLITNLGNKKPGLGSLF
jgi:hypothetical protein